MVVSEKLKLIFTQAIFIAFIIVARTSLGQNEPCGTDLHHQYALEHDENYRRLVAEREQLLLDPESNGLGVNREEVYTVPIVVHVVHLGEPLGVGTNISDVQIRNAIDGLNRRMRDLDSTGLDFKIQFCLTNLDPSGMPTTGITRNDFSSNADYVEGGVNVTGLDVGVSLSKLIELERWPWWEYLNIYVVNEVSNGEYNGYATYPTSESGMSVVMNYERMSESSSLLTHEIGHTLFLYHTFEQDSGGDECPPSDPCNEVGDRICDTPPHRRVTCGETNGCTSIGNWDNSRKNYMSYCSSRTLFTPEQYTRGRYQLNFTPWFYLITSTKCSGIPDNEENFILLPNPSKGSFVIQSSLPWKDGEIAIYDTLGRSISIQELSDSNDHLAKFIRLDVSEGLYFVSIKTKTSEQVLRLVVN